MKKSISTRSESPMVSCFKRVVTFALLSFVLSCGQDGVAPLTGGGCTSCKIFTTATYYTGDLGGIAGADAKCMADANKPGPGAYKALIVNESTRRACLTGNCSGGTSEHTDWVLKPNTEYVRSSDGAIIDVTDANGIFPFNLTNTLHPTLLEVYFSGLRADWTSSVAHCDGWTTTSGFLGLTGRLDITNTTAVDFTTGFCIDLNRLVCVEQ